MDLGKSAEEPERVWPLLVQAVDPPKSNRQVRNDTILRHGYEGVKEGKRGFSFRSTVRPEDRSQKVRVDRYVNDGMESHQYQGLYYQYQRIKGGSKRWPSEYVSAAHNWISLDNMTQVVNSGVTAKVKRP